MLPRTPRLEARIKYFLASFSIKSRGSWCDKVVYDCVVCVVHQFIEIVSELCSQELLIFRDTKGLERYFDDMKVETNGRYE